MNAELILCVDLCINQIINTNEKSTTNYQNTIRINSTDIRIKEKIETESIDFICIGGGLPDNERDEMESYIATIDYKIKVHPIPRTEEKMGPNNFIPSLNNLAIMHKVHKAMEE